MNKNVAVFKLLYEEAIKQLHEQIQSSIVHHKNLGCPPDGLKAQVSWIHEVGKSLILISQIESSRTTSGQTSSQPQSPQQIIKPQPPAGLADFNPPQPAQPRRDF